MDQYVSHCLTAALGLFSGYLLGYLNHGLASRREADERRRKFREEVRVLGLELDRANPHTFLDVYDLTVQNVRPACVRVSEDIRWRKRRSFERHRDEYCGFTHDDLQRRTDDCTPAQLDSRMKENYGRYQEKKQHLAQLLSALVRDAE